MKIASLTALLLTLFSSFSLQAETRINCQKDSTVVSLDVDSLRDDGEWMTKLEVRKDGQTIYSTTIRKEGEGFEDSLLNAYIWIFVNKYDKDLISVGTTQIKQKTPGIWAGVTDLFLRVPGAPLHWTTVPCRIEIK